MQQCILHQLSGNHIPQPDHSQVTIYQLLLWLSKKKKITCIKYILYKEYKIKYFFFMRGVSVIFPLTWGLFSPWHFLAFGDFPYGSLGDKYFKQWDFIFKNLNQILFSKLKPEIHKFMCYHFQTAFVCKT